MYLLRSMICRFVGTSYVQKRNEKATVIVRHFHFKDQNIFHDFLAKLLSIITVEGLKFIDVVCKHYIMSCIVFDKHILFSHRLKDNFFEEVHFQNLLML